MLADQNRLPEWSVGLGYLLRDGRVICSQSVKDLRAMAKKEKLPGLCMFCGRTGVTKQHMWPDWLGSVLPREGAEHTQFITRTHFPAPDKFVISPDLQFKRGPVGSRKIRKVCGKCNSGWMSVLENQAKPALAAMIRDEEFNIPTELQRILSAWAAMTAIVAECTDPLSQAIPPQDRVVLMDSLNPPEHWRIWFGRYRGQDWKQRYHHGGMLVARSLAEAPKYGGVPNTQASTFVVGHMLMYACSSTVMSPDTHLVPALASKLVRVWPISDRVFAWPPVDVLGDEEVKWLSNDIYSRCIA